MIYTLTTNPSIDYYLYSSKEIEEGINRPETYSFIAAGKGINVSRVLANNQIKNNCVMVCGGFTGGFIVDELKKEGLIQVTNIEINQPSRINVKTRYLGKELDLNTGGPAIPSEKLTQVIRTFESIQENDIVCICGSIQKEVKGIMVELAQLIIKQKGRLILDVPNLSLEEILACKPFLIKPNLEEVQKLLGVTTDYPAIIEVIQERITSKGTNVLLSLGGDGGCYISADEVYTVTAPKIDCVVNTVGAGDSMLAGFVGTLDQGETIPECLKFASATGSAAVTMEQLPDRKTIEKYLPEAIVQKIQ